MTVPKVHPSLQASFVPLPSDPQIPLTEEQLKAVFPHPEVWRDVIAMVLQQQAKRESDAKSPNTSENDAA